VSGRSGTAVAVAQLRCPADDAEERITTTVGAIEGAKDAGADLVVLPELAAAGYRLHDVHLQASSERGDGSGPVLGAWRAVARRRSIAVVGGFAESVPGGLANSAVVIDGSGAVVTVYRKMHLFGAEQKVFRPGDTGLSVLDVGGLRLGVLICYDLRFPETVRILALQGAELIAVPTAWIPGFDRAPRTDDGIGQVDGAVVQANLSQVYLACADQFGCEGDTRFLGRSLVVDPYGEIVAGPLPEGSAGLVSALVDPTEAERARYRGPGISPRLNRRTDVYGDLLGYTGQGSESVEP